VIVKTFKTGVPLLMCRCRVISAYHLATAMAT